MGGYKFGKGVPTWNGMPMVGGAIFTTGSSFFVSSGIGSDGNRGTSPDKPFATINKAVSACTASKADVIYCMPGHGESIGDTSTSGAMDLDVAGITLVGLGTGSLQPKITFAHADADFIVGASDVTITGMHFFAAITGVKLGVAIETLNTGTTISNCKFSVEETTVDEFLIAINLTVGCDGTIIKDNIIDMGLGGATDGVALVGASADIRIENNEIIGDYSLGNITAITTLSTEVKILNNLLVNGGSGNLSDQPVIDFITNCTGVCADNYMCTNVATDLASINSADLLLYTNNYYNNTAGVGKVGGKYSATVVASIDE